MDIVINYKKILFACSALLLLPPGLWAQNKQNRDSVIKNQTIIIHQIYQPEVKQPSKSILTPQLPPPDTTKPIFQYVIPQQTLSYTYRSVPIRPLALGKIEEKSPFQNYVKLGFGNLSSIYIDAGVGSIRGKNYETNFHFTHLNQKGKLTAQNESVTELKASGKYFTPKNILEAGLYGRLRGYHFYGGDIPVGVEYGYPKQRFWDGGINLGLQNRNTNDLDIDYHPEISFGTALYGVTDRSKENKIGFNLPVDYHFGAGYHTGDKNGFSGKLSLSLYGNFIRYSSDPLNEWNSLFQISPAIELTQNDYTLRLGVSPAVGMGDFYLLPDLSLKTKEFAGQIRLSLGWKSQIRQNSYLDMTLINPYIAPEISSPNLILPYTVQQTHEDQLFLGIAGKAGNALSYGATLSWRQWKNMPMFLNNFDQGLGHWGENFILDFDPKVRAFNLDGFVRYQPNEIISVEAQASFYNYYSHQEEDVLGYPSLKFNAGLGVHPFKKLYTHAGLTFLDGIRAIDGSASSTGVPIIRLPGFVDVNLSGEYNIISRLSVFAQINNLLNQKNQRWYLYPTYGFNILGGLRLKF